MRLIPTAKLIAAGLALAGFGTQVPIPPPGQGPVQTIELPSLDESRVAFRLDVEPFVVVGRVQAPGAYFGMPNRVTTIADGSAIAFSTPWGYSALHILDSTGRIRAIGNFSATRQLQTTCAATGDRLLVFHSRAQFTFYQPSGAAGPTGSVPDDGSEALCPAIESLVWVRTAIREPNLGQSQTPHDGAATSRRAKAVLRLLDLNAGSRVVADLGEFATGELYPVGPIPPVPGVSRPPTYLWAQRPFGRELATAVDGLRLHIGDGTTWEIRTWNSTGQLVRVLRVLMPPEPMSAELRAAFIEREFAGNTADFRARWVELWNLRDPATYPSSLPAFSDLRVDRVGRLWVRRYLRPQDTVQNWWVFAADARYLGRVQMPSALTVDEIGDDYVAGSYLRRKVVRPETDALRDISEYDVRVYRLRPS